MGGDGHGSILEITSTEMRVEAPDTLPPSPPLTDTEVLREEDHEPTPKNHQSPEEDIINFHTSSSGEGSWQEDDLGYSTAEPTPIDNRRLSAAHHVIHNQHYHRGSSSNSTPLAGTSSGKHRHVPEHPLRLDVHPPSPPPWEVIDPPETNNTPQGALFPESARDERIPKPSTSRPLIPYSSYYFGPPPIDAAYGTNPIGHIGFHYPREIVRVERDYSGGELIQFSPVYPLELEGRITPTQFLETVNSVNELLLSAHSLRYSFVENCLSFFTLQLSRVVLKSHYEKEMDRLEGVIGELNRRLYNPVGLNILWPKRVAFMFLEIEYY